MVQPMSLTLTFCMLLIAQSCAGVLTESKGVSWRRECRKPTCAARRQGED